MAAPIRMNGSTVWLMRGGKRFGNILWSSVTFIVCSFIRKHYIFFKPLKRGPESSILAGFPNVLPSGVFFVLLIYHVQEY